MVWKMITNRIIKLLKRIVFKPDKPKTKEVIREEVEEYLKRTIPELNMRLVLEEAADKENVLWIESITVTAYRANKEERR